MLKVGCVPIYPLSLCSPAIALFFMCSSPFIIFFTPHSLIFCFLFDIHLLLFYSLFKVLFFFLCLIQGHAVRLADRCFGRQLCCSALERDYPPWETRPTGMETSV